MKSILTLLVLTMAASFSYAEVNCTVESGNGSGIKFNSQHQLKSDQRFETSQGRLEITVQVIGGRLAQVMVTDKETYLFTQEEPKLLHATGKGKAFMQNLSSGEYASVNCTEN